MTLKEVIMITRSGRVVFALLVLGILVVGLLAVPRLPSNDPLSQLPILKLRLTGTSGPILFEVTNCAASPMLRVVNFPFKGKFQVVVSKEEVEKYLRSYGKIEADNPYRPTHVLVGGRDYYSLYSLLDFNDFQGRLVEVQQLSREYRKLLFIPSERTIPYGLIDLPKEYWQGTCPGAVKGSIELLYLVD